MHISIKRPAIAMIELIFAIVIMGIVMMGAPMLVSMASKSVTVALQQEGINEAASRVSMLLTHAWDEQDTGDSCTPPVLRVSTAGDSELNVVTGNRRVGIPFNSNSRTFNCGTINEMNASTTLGGDPGDTVKDDVDDFTNTTLVVDTSGAGGKDYIEQTTVSIATAINYISDAATYSSTTIAYAPGGAPATSTNIKAITVTLTSTAGSAAELTKNIVLSAFSCNIGGYEFVSREF